WTSAPTVSRSVTGCCSRRRITRRCVANTAIRWKRRGASVRRWACPCIEFLREETAMTLSIRAIDPASRPFFAGEVSGVDIARPLSQAEAAAIASGMDEFGVLVFRDQRFTDETQLAFSRNFGALEQATGDIAQGHERRLSMDVNDISNLDKDNRLLA